MGKQNATISWIVAAVVVVVVVVAGVFLVRRALHPAAASGPAAASSSAPAASASSMLAIRHPLGQAQAGLAHASTAPLPALADSDTEVAAALAALAGGDHLRDLLVPGQSVARIVATIDALPRHAGLGNNVLPARTPKGTFVIATTAGGTVMGAENAARYAPYMPLVSSVDPQALVAWYVHAYPLFQEAYRQLGYPHGYFNDRLIVVIDDLLAAPELAQPAPLQVAKSYYTYVDPALESLSTGQKLLLRTGPANEATIKAKLREIRAALVGQGPRAAPAASSRAK